MSIKMLPEIPDIVRRAAEELPDPTASREDTVAILVALPIDWSRIPPDGEVPAVIQHECVKFNRHCPLPGVWAWQSADSGRLFGKGGSPIAIPAYLSGL